jgi:DNA repair exonuclease SbcCD ATPase subunit
MIKTLVGHKGGLQGDYNKLEELLEENVKAIDLLTINDENGLKAKVATLEDRDKKIRDLEKQLEQSNQDNRTTKEQIAKMKESQLRIIEWMNNPTMVQHIRANPQEFIGAANAADEDTANFIKQVSEQAS